MTRIVLDVASREKLDSLTEPAELCDDQGRVIGRFFPRTDPGRFAPLEPQVSEDELRRREQSADWYTTAEVLANLESK